MAFKEMLKLRRHLNMSQADMAMYLGVKDKELISQWENGYRNPTEPIKRLVRYLNDMRFRKAKGFLIQMRLRSTK
jgi:DNA-binding transcriptional regulator YiaG